MREAGLTWGSELGQCRVAGHPLDHYRGCMGDLAVWAFELAGEKLAGALPRRWAHVQGVGRRARVVAPLFSVND
ncbi:MAG: hypothetical protein ACREQV_25240, partial [Candidatus Binatia bacterium]